MQLSEGFVDLIIVVALIYFTLETWGRPLILKLIDLVSFLLAFFLSFRYYNYPAQFFQTQFQIAHGFSLVLGFMATWFLSEMVFYFLTQLILSKVPHLKIPGEKFVSLIPSFLRGLIFISLFLILIATFPIQPSIKKAVLDSKIGSFILSNTYALEEPVKQVFGGITKDSLSFMTIEPKTNERISLGFRTDQFQVDEADEKVMIGLVNKERVSRGLKSLTFEVKLESVARSHSEDMFKRGYFSHFSPEGETVADRANKLNIEYIVIGENLAFAPSLDLAHTGLMNSPGHRANILSVDYNKIGIGVMDGGVYGKMFTQVFSN